MVTGGCASHVRCDGVAGDLLMQRPSERARCGLRERAPRQCAACVYVATRKWLPSKDVARVGMEWNISLVRVSGQCECWLLVHHGIFFPTAYLQEYRWWWHLRARFFQLDDERQCVRVWKYSVSHGARWDAWRHAGCACSATARPAGREQSQLVGGRAVLERGALGTLC